MLRLIGPDPLTMTSEPKIDVSYRLEADDDPVLQRGVAVAWIDHDPFHLPGDRSGEPVPPLAMPLARGKSKDLTHSVAAPLRTGVGSATAAARAAARKTGREGPLPRSDSRKDDRHRVRTNS